LREIDAGKIEISGVKVLTLDAYMVQWR